MSIHMKRIPADASTCGAVVSDIRIEAKCHEGGINIEVRYSKKLLPTLVAVAAVLDTPVLCQVPNLSTESKQNILHHCWRKILVIWPCAVIRENEWLANERESLHCSTYNCA